MQMEQLVDGAARPAPAGGRARQEADGGPLGARALQRDQGRVGELGVRARRRALEGGEALGLGLGGVVQHSRSMGGTRSVPYMYCTCAYNIPPPCPIQYFIKPHAVTFIDSQQTNSKIESSSWEVNLT